MTRISPSLYPAPNSPRAQLPAGEPTAILTHGTSAVSCRDEFDAVTSVKGNECASEAVSPQPQEVKALPSIQQAFERLNAPQMRNDRWDQALPPVWLMLLAAVVCVTTLLVADVMYSAFFQWMTGVSL